MADSYIELAIEIIEKHKRPLSAREILFLAEKSGNMPYHLHGKTQEKTLGARLSEHILRFGQKSLIYRTSPGRFFARSLQASTGDSRKEWFARARKKELGRETVLTVSRFTLRDLGLEGMIDDVETVLQLLRGKSVQYTERKIAEKDYSLKQVVTYVIVSKGDYVLSYRRGKFTTVSDELRGQRSIGFGGHVTIDDADFLDQATLGIVNNATRELLEELRLESDESRRLQKGDSLHLISFLNVDDSEEAQKHIAAILFYCCGSQFEPRKGELSINDLNWLDLNQRPNNPNDFELWSRILLDHMRDTDFRSRLPNSRT